MKLRIGFVSNSSSCSFAVAVDSEDQTLVNMKIDLKKYGTVIKNVEDLVEFLNDHYSCDLEDDKDIAELMDGTSAKVSGFCNEDQVYSIVEKLKQGKVVIAGSASDQNGDGIETAICYGALNDLDDVDILYGGDGY
jgi:hypothetical protein